MSLLYFLNADKQKCYAALQFIRIWAGVIEDAIIRDPARLYPDTAIDVTQHVCRDFGAEKALSVSLIYETINILEKTIYEAPARENRLHLLSLIVNDVDYPHLKSIYEHLHPECKCDWQLKMSDRMSQEDRQKEWQRARQAREKGIDKLMLKYNIPSQFRPNSITGVSESNSLSWDRSNEIIERILLEYPDADKNILYYYISLASNGIRLIIRFLEKMMAIYNIKPSEINNIQTMYEDQSESNTQKSDNAVTTSYETMPSTYRRAAVMALIDKSGLCKNIDRTKKAAFVEAVTGGNINANPKDSVSYKKPEQKAINAATELLKTIGIE